MLSKYIDFIMPCFKSQRYYGYIEKYECTGCFCLRQKWYFSNIEQLNYKLGTPLEMSTHIKKQNIMSCINTS